jgi:hypothetical protein
MTSTYTPNKDFELPGYNDYVDSWNTPVNTNFTELDTALGGSTLLNATGASGDTVLTVTQYRPPLIIVSGVLTANVRLVVPAAVGGQWTVTNGTTGAFTLTMASAAGGSNITIPSGTTIVSCDGSSSGMRLSITSTSVQRVDTFTAGTTGLTPAVASVGNISLAGTLNIANGGTQTTTAPTSGQLLIGRSDGTYAVNNLTGGSGITINNGNGSIEIVASSTAGGTVTSVGMSAGTTGMTWTSSSTNPIVSSGTFTLGGTLAVGHGGIGISSTPLSGQFPIGTGTTYSLGSIQAGSGIGVSLSSGNYVIANNGVTSISAGTGITVSSSTGGVTISAPAVGTVTSVGLSTTLSGISVSGSPVTTSGTLSLSGTLGVSSGGTGTGTAFTTGSVVFAGASGVYSQSNSNFFWDNTNSRLGLGTTSPSNTLSVSKSLSSNYVVGIVNSSATAGSGAMQVSSQTGFAIDSTTNSTSAGVYSTVGTNLAAGGGSGAVGVSSGSGGYAFRSLAGGYSPFTGCHDGFILKTASPSPGDLLVDDVVVGKKLSDVVTEVSVSTAVNQPVIGIFVLTYPTELPNVPPALKQPDGSPDPAWYVYAPTHNLAVINSVGEGCLNVVGEGGNITKGDLLVASSTPGKAMKQADDIVRSYTVARAREDAAFAPGEEKQIACIYLCG